MVTDSADRSRTGPVAPRARLLGPFLVALGLALLLLAGCADDGTGNGATSETGEESAVTSGAGGASSTTAVPGTTTPIPATAAAPDQAREEDLHVEVVAEGLIVPWEMRFLPDGNLLVTERTGRVVRIDLPEGQPVPLGQVDVAAIGESGLLGFDLDPDYPDAPYMYVAYTHTEGNGLTNRLSRFEIDGDRLGPERILLDGIPGGQIHDGSRVGFGPDGYLWMTTGDAGQADLAQDTGSLAGKVLRVDREGRPAPDNPMTDSPMFTWGHRNPQGLDWNPATNQAFITEHGPDTDDEVNALEAGANYGWPEVRGFGGGDEFHDPVTTWTPTIAPAGAVFYDADLIPGWRGAFVFVTLKESDLRVLVPRQPEFGEVAEELVLFDEDYGRLRPVRVGPDGALYVGTSNRDGRGNPGANDDRILRIAPRGE